MVCHGGRDIGCGRGTRGSLAQEDPVEQGSFLAEALRVVGNA